MILKLAHAVSFLIGAAFVAMILWALGILPTHVNYCYESEGGHKECAVYNIALVTLWQIDKGLNWSFTAITAIATGFIAYFTLTLKRSTDQLWIAGNKQITIAKDASLAATKTADAAISSLRLARRGFVSFKRYTVHKIGDDPNDLENTGFVIVCWFENVGSAPAIIKKTVFRWRTILSDDTSPFNWDTPIEDQSSNIPIGHGTEVHTNEFKITLGAARKVFNNEIKIYVLIRIEYGDMFDLAASYHTQICYEVQTLIDPVEIFLQNLSQSQYITIPIVGEHCSAS